MVAHRELVGAIRGFVLSIRGQCVETRLIHIHAWGCLPERMYLRRSIAPSVRTDGKVYFWKWLTKTSEVSASSEVCPSSSLS